MYLEYGIAKTAGIETIIVHSERLPDKIWTRVAGGTENLPYNDLTFERITIEKIITSCERISLSFLDDMDTLS
jgi:hypothetical protein